MSKEMSHRATHVNRNYKYRRLTDSDSDIDRGNEALELSNRAPHTGSDKPIGTFKVLEYDSLFERPIQQGESLASISLKYRISIADLKRVNKLHKETEFYALSTLKIPVKNNSVLHEVLLEENSHKVDIPNSLGQRISSSSEIESEIDMPVGIISISQICREKTTRKEARHFLMNMQKDLQKLQEKTHTYKGSLNEASATLTSVSFSSIENKKLGCSGADWDLSWWKVLTVGGAIVIGVPFLYLLIYSS